MKSTKTWLALSLLLLGAAQAGPANNSLVVGTSQEPPNIYDPWATNNLAISSEINGFMAASLISKDNEGDLYADIATTVPTLANGGYKLTKNAAGDVTSNSVTYSIRKDAKWSDGSAITPKDFQFWLKVEQDDRVPVPSRDPWDKAKITVNDADTFTITFNPPYLFADQVSPGLAPSASMAGAWNSFDSATAKLDSKTSGKAINDAWVKFISSFTTANNLPKVVSGAFKPTQWRSGNSLTMVRNANYWRTPKGGTDKYVQTVQYRFIPNTNTLKVNVLSGQIDTLSAVGVTFDQGLDLQRSQRDRYKTYFVPSATWEHIDINGFSNVQKVKDLDLDDKRVRQALLYSIDRAALTKALFQGKQQVSNTFVNPIAKLYKKDAKAYDFDPAKAKALFADAGWKPGADGILAKNGKKFSLNFTTTAGNATRERVQQILQAQWKAVGVDVNIQNYPSSVVFAQDFIGGGSNGKWDMLMYAWTADPSLEKGNLFSSTQIPTAGNGFAGQNEPGWKNAEYDKLWNQANTEFDLSARVKLFDRMQSIWADEVPSLPLYFRVNVYTKVPNLMNYTFSAYSLYPSWDAYEIGWSSKGAAEVNTQK
ncbi:peptide ABC transporter substrate-binding protein [Deinococcus sp. KNUC1210]|uniref:peptide ABC transporter substrate-binding protein n=1 Tax=Deinococcus sp. KNUC1210 TaxID=2917691 RepID=UPI001EF0F533|nr:peptide ABC transporter substrate-binding protein [Deinococcus sp. KNUC1210]ULH14455.1 peptide ABC transporter substrate-binding protein [Deinococcus sp. KNUC1210]